MDYLRDMPDEKLMEHVALGARPAMEPLVRRHGVRLLTFISRMVGDPHRAEEIFQESFLAVWAKAKLFHRERAFRPWLFAIAANKCRECLRRSRSGPRLVEAMPDGPDPPDAGDWSGSGTLLAAETSVRVRRAVAALPEKQREVLVLSVWCGMTSGEIGAALSMPEGTVRSHMHHALAGLRGALAADEHG